MPRPLTKDQVELLRKAYYEKGAIGSGRDKLWNYVKNIDAGISQRAVMNWLSKQEIHQIHTRQKTTKDLKSSLYTKPHQSLGIDLTNLQNLERNDFKYLCNAVDMFSRKLYLVPMKQRESKDILAAFKLIHKQVPKLKGIRCDNEFSNKLLKDYLDW